MDASSQPFMLGRIKGEAARDSSYFYKNQKLSYRRENTRNTTLVAARNFVRMHFLTAGAIISWIYSSPATPETKPTNDGQ